MKPNCYECQYRDLVPGSCHSSCNHPAVTSSPSSPMAEMMSVLASVGRAPGFSQQGGELNIKGNPYGIKSGWFIWPYNFDPVWLENCDGFKGKDNPNGQW